VDQRLCLEVLVRELEAVVPQEVLPGAHLLLLLPRPDPVLVPLPPLELLVDELVLSSSFGWPAASSDTTILWSPSECLK